MIEVGDAWISKDDQVVVVDELIDDGGVEVVAFVPLVGKVRKEMLKRKFVVEYKPLLDNN